MRVLITSATVVDGTGSAARPGHSLLIEDGIITDVVARPALTYDRSDIVIDARDAVVLPGIVNHHAHGLTRGPLMIIGEPPLTDQRVLSNLRKHLSAGTTSALNVDGFPTVEDAVAVTKLQPVNVKVSTLHTPGHLSWAADGPFPMGGVADRHRWTVEEMFDSGAVAVGEAGPGIDGHWADHTLIPLVIEQATGRGILPHEARELREATEGLDRDRLLAALDRSVDRDESFLPTWRAGYERIKAWSELASKALDEAIEAANAHHRPLVFHHTPTTFPLLLDAADRLGGLLIAAHSQLQATSTDDLIRRARALKDKGAWIDVMGGDSFGVKMFFPEPTQSFALMREGLVDAISTDYCGGYWDSLLRVGVEAWRAGATTLEGAVKMLTSNPARMVPGLAPRRGVLAAGMVADIVVTDPADPAVVRNVLISGRPVTLPADTDLLGPVPSAHGCC